MTTLNGRKTLSWWKFVTVSHKRTEVHGLHSQTASLAFLSVIQAASKNSTFKHQEE